MADIMIIGGHGKIALLLAPLLDARGDAVTAVIRNPDQADDIRAAGATPLVLDVENATRDQLAEALDGFDAIVWSAGAGGGNPDRTYAVDRDAAIRTMEAAGQAGVDRFVMVSYLGAGPNHGVPSDEPFFAYAEAKAAADTALRETRLDWTILMPGALTLDEPSGTIDPAAIRAANLPGTSRANVALVAAAALATPSSVRQNIAFTDGSVPIEVALAAL
ncbi:NAD(P)H-binding protein [Gordonia sp. HY002]|uniref:NAD(P)H-binding protein n=1 Tax=Gordonia zhenghanii TaxID=2911516 RepID=UPI001EF0F848|nr:NAD(P)H-binding protein [Gordonia zhenghanii]MCF8571001.1 NAD(P)H-binding protein [Gordonia zhenghanii]MCF8607481.1 NAD(P)H-binding protein [Gordonia zhenghanii]